MSRSVKAIGICLGAGLLGAILSIAPLSMELQENFGLKLLFHLRGPLPPPTEVLIVALDRESAEALDLPTKTEAWPRKLHAQLVRTLSRLGATAIIFDLLFDEPRDADADQVFGAAIAESNRVVLCEAIRQEKLPIFDSSGQHLADVNVETLVPPISPLARSALSLAPFPLPKVPVQLSQFWLFKAGSGNSPTLPAAAFFIYAGNHYDSFSKLFNKVVAESGGPEELPTWEEIAVQRRLEETMIAIKEKFNREPLIAREMQNQIESRDRQQADMLTGLIRMFQSENSRYLNFYGPAGTVNTMSYHDALKIPDRSAKAKGDSTSNPMGLEGKVVFVGLSENMRLQRQDGYHTVFSQRNGIDISGVEIAATAFANLLEGRLLTVLGWPLNLGIVFAFGFFLGMICFFLPMGVATVCVLSTGALYLSTAWIFFSMQNIWLPVVIPVFILMPLALFGTVVCRYCVASKEHSVLRKAFGYYLPDPVIDHLAKNIGDINATNTIVYGICLYTDAQQYAALSEAMDPKALSLLMNRYYQKLFIPVKKYGGMVSDVVGDSLMAIWAKANPDVSIRAAACHAALEMVQAINAFNREDEQISLHTRIGMHAGPILIGNIGAVDHYEYRPVGDIVNTASRMESLNKHLGTQILVSDQVLQHLDGFMSRGLGKFLLFGKTNPVAIYELLGYSKDINLKQHQIGSCFAEGLVAFQQKRWDAAIAAFERTLSICHCDGPALFYKNRCEELKQNPPGESWDGTVTMGQK
ncbi:CHASE2 domain-containing protein [Desulfosarcina sp.]|uniref:CHASE2 domain-containing protein n=1 Tax=Desulfosarcina sp. TaxID=2027861 RepID=UPI0039704CBB